MFETAAVIARLKIQDKSEEEHSIPVKEYHYYYYFKCLKTGTSFQYLLNIKYKIKLLLTWDLLSTKFTNSLKIY